MSIAEFTKRFGKAGATTITVNQKVSDFGKNAAFSEWQRKLGRNDTLPRGKHFKSIKSRLMMLGYEEGVCQVKL